MEQESNLYVVTQKHKRGRNDFFVITPHKFNGNNLSSKYKDENKGLIPKRGDIFVGSVIGIDSSLVGVIETKGVIDGEVRNLGSLVNQGDIVSIPAQNKELVSSRRDPWSAYTPGFVLDDILVDAHVVVRNTDFRKYDKATMGGISCVVDSVTTPNPKTYNDKYGLVVSHDMAELRYEPNTVFLTSLHYQKNKEGFTYSMPGTPKKSEDLSDFKLNLKNLGKHFSGLEDAKRVLLLDMKVPYEFDGAYEIGGNEVVQKLSWFNTSKEYYYLIKWFLVDSYTTRKRPPVIFANNTFFSSDLANKMLEKLMINQEELTLIN